MLLKERLGSLKTRRVDLAIPRQEPMMVRRAVKRVSLTKFPVSSLANGLQQLNLVWLASRPVLLSLQATWKPLDGNQHALLSYIFLCRALVDTCRYFASTVHHSRLPYVYPRLSWRCLSQLFAFLFLFPRYHSAIAHAHAHLQTPLPSSDHVLGH
jgi:hypothetical protein